jgi:hypothetical protein
MLFFPSTISTKSPPPFYFTFTYLSVASIPFKSTLGRNATFDFLMSDERQHSFLVYYFPFVPIANLDIPFVDSSVAISHRNIPVADGNILIADPNCSHLGTRICGFQLQTCYRQRELCCRRSEHSSPRQQNTLILNATSRLRIAILRSPTGNLPLLTGKSHFPTGTVVFPICSNGVVHGNVSVILPFLPVNDRGNAVPVPLQSVRHWEVSVSRPL